MSVNSKLSTWQLMLLSTGGMIGAGWLFSPYYGFKIAGVGVAISWLIVAIMTSIIGLSFAEVSTRIPLVGGIARYVSVTHSQPLAFVFLLLGWLSYVVYLPLEIQSCVQYLGFWFSSLVHTTHGGTTLSLIGLVVSLLIMLLLTWFNTLAVKTVAKANSLLSVWKILIPLSIAWVLILGFGDWHNFSSLAQTHKVSSEEIFLAITQGGLAFAFTGFQNGLILANSVKNPQKSLPYSIFTPLVVGFLLYCSLSLAFIFCVGSNKFSVGASAPLLGLVALFGIHIIFVILFFDAVIAPLGTANVYTAVTARILLGLTRDFLPKSLLARLNANQAPVYCLWFNMCVGMCFLLPFPTWTQLVDFLSSLVVFAYIAGPVSLIVMRQIATSATISFRVWHYKLVANLGFICCSLIIYWSGLTNLAYLLLSIVLILLVYSRINREISLAQLLRNTALLVAYVAVLFVVSYLRKINIILFPYDNLLIMVFALIMCRALVSIALKPRQIEANLDKYHHEI